MSHRVYSVATWKRRLFNDSQEIMIIAQNMKCFHLQTALCIFATTKKKAVYKAMYKIHHKLTIARLFCFSTLQTLWYRIASHAVTLCILFYVFYFFFLNSPWCKKRSADKPNWPWDIFERSKKQKKNVLRYVFRCFTFSLYVHSPFSDR